MPDRERKIEKELTQESVEQEYRIQEVREKSKSLYDMLRDIALWDDDGSRNDEAREVFEKFYFELKCTKPDNVYDPGNGRYMWNYHFAYIFLLVPAETAFRQGLYRRAAHETADVFRKSAQLALQQRVKVNIMAMINSYLHIEPEYDYNPTHKYRRVTKLAKHESKTDKKLDAFKRHQFDSAVDFQRIPLEVPPDIEDKIHILTFMIECIKRELAAEDIGRLFYSKEPVGSPETELITTVYKDNEGNEHNIVKESNITREIDFSKDCVIVQPGNRDSLIDKAVKVWRYGFKQTINHKANYYEYIDLCCIYQGTHSGSAAVIKREGSMTARSIDTTALFPHIRTDGAYWYNVHDREDKKKVYDFRYAVLYEAARKRYELEYLKSEMKHTEKKSEKEPEYEICAVCKERLYEGNRYEDQRLGAKLCAACFGKRLMLMYARKNRAECFVCSHCGKREGLCKYYRFQGQLLCQDCLSKHLLEAYGIGIDVENYIE